MNLPQIFVDRPVTTIMVFLAIFALGAVSFFGLPIDLFPEIEPPVISVITNWDGASAQDVERNISKEIETGLSSISGLDKITSISIDNLSAVQLQFKWGTNLDEAANEIRNSLEFTKRRLPDDAEEPIIFKFGSNFFPVLFVSVTAEESYLGLNKLIEDRVADKLRRIPGVGTVIIFGGPIREIKVGIDPKRLESYNLDIPTVARAIRAENITLPVGSVKMGQLEYNLRVPGEFTDPLQVGDVVISSQGGRLVYLRDIATVLDTLKERTIGVRLQGAKGLQMVVQKQSGANTVDVARGVKAKLVQLQADLPADVKVNVVQDSSDFINNSIANLTEAIILGGLFVILVVLLFLREWRGTVIVSLTIPFSLIVAFIYLFVSGKSLNIISMSSLSIAIGLVVDDAIVILENVSRHIESGARPREASVFGSSEVGLAVVASTLTIVAVFLPMALLTGIAGVFFNELGVLVTITILTSLFAALTLVPMLSSRMLYRREARQARGPLARVYAISERWFTGIESFYGRSLDVALNHRLFTVLVASGVFVASLFLLPFVGAEFLPQSDDGSMQINIEMEPGTKLEESMATAAQVEAILKSEVPEARFITTRAGVNDEGFSSILFGQREGLNIFTTQARLVPKAERTRSVFEIADTMRTRIVQLPGVSQYSVSTAGAGAFLVGATGKKMEVDVIGYDVEQTTAIANRILEIANRTPGAVDAALSIGKERPELEIALDREKIASLGLSTRYVSEAIRSGIKGEEANKYRESGEEYAIFVRYDPLFRNQVTDIENVPIRSPLGQIVKLKDVGNVHEVLSPPEIRRKDQERVISVGLNVTGRPLGDVAADIESEIAKLDLPPEIDIEYGGQVEQQQESFTDLTALLILSILLVYMIMASQFESLLHPFVIMFSVPFAFVGVILGLFVTGIPLSAISFLAIIMLIGIVVKNAIIVVDFTNILRARGLELREAIVSAGKHRLRPILMTTIAAIMGMAPLAIGAGEGAEIWRPLGVTVISGLTVSTIISLILVPVIYSLFERRAFARGGQGPVTVSDNAKEHV